MKILNNTKDISCKKATYLVCKSSIEKLTIKEDQILKFHYTLCSYCEKFSKQLLKIDKLLTLGANKENLTLRKEKKELINQLVTNYLQKK